MDMRDLTYEDLEDIEVDPSWSGLNCLAVVAQRAAELYEHPEKFQEFLREKKKKKPLLIGNQPKISSKPKEVYMASSVLKNSSKNGALMNDSAETLSREETLKRERLLKRPVDESCVVKKKEMLMNDTIEPVLICEEILKSESLLKRPIIRENCVAKKKEMLTNGTKEPVQTREEILKRERLLKRPTEENCGVKNKRIKISSREKIKPNQHHCLNGQVMPMEFKNRILELAKGRHVSEETLVIQKKLFATDCSKEQSRFTIPKNQVVQDFLTDEEEAELCLHDGSEMRFITVSLIEPSLQRRRVCLRRWNLKKRGENSSVSYVLNGPNWNEIRKHNGLEVGMMVQLWAVRIEEELWLVLVRVPKEGEQSVGVRISSDANTSSGNSNQS